MSNSDLQVEVLSGRRGCLIWWLVLLVIASIGAVYNFRQELGVAAMVQDAREQIAETWSALTGDVAPPAPDFEAVVVQGYHKARQALLLSALNDENYTHVQHQLHVFVTGEALAQLQAEGESLRTNNRYQINSLDHFAIVQALVEGDIAKLLTRERHQAKTLERQAGGDAPVESRNENVQGVYQLTFDGQRWLVERAAFVTP